MSDVCCCNKFETCKIDCIARLHWHDSLRSDGTFRRMLGDAMKRIRELETIPSEIAPLDSVLRELALACNKYADGPFAYYLHGLWRARDIVLALKNAAPQANENGAIPATPITTAPAVAAPETTLSATRPNTDAARIDFLERYVAREPLLLHNLDTFGKSTGFNGLGLASTNRTLRQAIDDLMGFEKPPARPEKGANPEYPDPC